MVTRILGSIPLMIYEHGGNDLVDKQNFHHKRRPEHRHNCNSCSISFGCNFLFYRSSRRYWCRRNKATHQNVYNVQYIV